jgi:hypothetical protein
MLFWLSNTETDPRWAGRIALPLSMTLAADPLAAGLVSVVAVGALIRFPRQIPIFVLWGLPGGALAVAVLVKSRLAFTGLACGEGHVALLVSPLGGILFFAPVTIVACYGVVRAFRGGERFWTLTLAGAVLVHGLLMGCLAPALDGNEWGYLGMTAALPLLFFFLPDGFLGWPRLGWLLAALTFSIQLIGAFGGAQRRCESAPEDRRSTTLWSMQESPLFRWIQERVMILSIPVTHDRRIVYREHRQVLFGKQGSRIVFGDSGPQVTGVEATLSDVHPLGAARTKDDRLMLERPGDGLFLRVSKTARVRELQLRVVGQGRGSLTVEERTFWTDEPRVKRYQLSAAFRIRRRYHYPESGGDEILIRLESGSAAVRAVLLVGPNEPDEVFTL